MAYSEKTEKDGTESLDKGEVDENNDDTGIQDITTSQDKQDKKKDHKVTKNLPGIDDQQNTDDDDDEGIDLGDTTDLDGEERNKLFERGVAYDQAGKKNLALKCYMACLNGLKEDSWFPLLPQCLRNIGDIFYQKEEYEKAVHFIQAEKLYYESALIDTSDLHHRLEEQKNGNEGGNIQEVNIDVARADEYEHLAKLCLDKKQPQLALEYAGKAAKLRQKVFGDDDPVTMKSLDFFATIYAEVGAEQYQDSLKKFTTSLLTDDDSSSDNPGEVPEVYSEDTTDEVPVSILRKRKNSEKEKHVRFEESLMQEQQQQAEKEEKFAKRILWGLFLVCSVVLTILGVYIYCHMAGSKACTDFKNNIHYTFMRLKYYYYHFSSTSKEKYT